MQLDLWRQQDRVRNRKTSVSQMAGYEASPAWQGIGIFQHHLLINHLGQQQYPQMTGHKIPFRLFPGTPVIYDFH